MIVLINLSNLSVGGGVQVGISFIQEISKLSEGDQYHVVVNDKVRSLIGNNIISNEIHFHSVKNSPAQLNTRRIIVNQLRKIEREVCPDVVFSIFGPTYWRPTSVHVAGFALGWITNPKTLAYEKLPFIDKLKRKLDSSYKTFYLKRDVDVYIVETEDVKSKLVNVLSLDKDIVNVVGNTHSSIFSNDYDIYDFPKNIVISDNCFRLITISHNYSHKNLIIIKDVVNYLLSDSREFKFFVTISEDDYSTMFNGFEEHVINLGPVEPRYCPSIYEQCDALFLPTLLESFSASYPEAMKMKKPIITTDLDFAHNICADAALYFEPLNAESAAIKIKHLSQDESLYYDLVDKGIRRLATFETAETRARKYMNILNKYREKK